MVFSTSAQIRCPFCKKVRAFLDFSGLTYDVVEVNPVTKKQLGWSTYKKVPIVMVKVKEGYQVDIVALDLILYRMKWYD